jgi:hypothetical protein
VPLGLQQWRKLRNPLAHPSNRTFDVILQRGIKNESFFQGGIDHDRLEKDCKIDCVCTNLSTLIWSETKCFYNTRHLFESRKESRQAQGESHEKGEADTPYRHKKEGRRVPEGVKLED